MSELAVLAGFVLAFGLISGRIEDWPLTGPMIFVAFGLLIGPDVGDLITFEIDDQQVILLAEATLAVILFSDAARIDLRALRHHVGVPARLLLIGLPATIGLGTVLVRLLLDLPWAVAALVAAILAPTDAALGQAVLTKDDVPVRIRASLNVESGLNDGLALPAVTLFLALSQADVGVRTTSGWFRFLAEQVGFGILVGLFVGSVGGWLLARAGDRDWMDGAHAQLGALALLGSAYSAAVLLDGNPFISAFVAGLAFDRVAPAEAAHRTEFAEDLGRLLAMLTFIVFGNTLVGPALGHLTFAIVACAVTTLTFGRMLPIRLALAGTRLRWPSVLFLGWFGPRGLASVLFGLLVLEDAGFRASDTVFSVVSLTVLASVFAHGMTAAPLADRYAAWYVRHRRTAHGPMEEDADEEELASEPRVRWAPPPRTPPPR